MIDDTLTGEEHGGGLMSSAFFMVAAGAAVGAAVALIFAPASGRDTRAFLGERGKSLADDVAQRGRKVWSEHGERVTSALRRGYDQATHNATEQTPTPHQYS